MKQTTAPRIRFDRPAHTYTADDVRAAAWSLYARLVHAVCHHVANCAPNFSDIDRRYNFNRETLAEFRRIYNPARLSADRDTVRDRRKGANWPRMEREGVNVLQSPIVRDYYEHRDQLRAVQPYCLDFYGRNHWAKNDSDVKALQILARNFARYQESRKS